MKTSEAREVVAQAVRFGLIDFNEAKRRQNAISRVGGDKRRTAVWVEDLIPLVEQVARSGRVVTIGDLGVTDDDHTV